MKGLPLPTWLSAHIFPPCDVMILLAIVKPRPVPCRPCGPWRLPWLNFSKIDTTLSAGLPCPESFTQISIFPLAVFSRPHTFTPLNLHLSSITTKYHTTYTPQ